MWWKLGRDLNLYPSPWRVRLSANSTLPPGGGGLGRGGFKWNVPYFDLPSPCPLPPGARVRIRSPLPRGAMVKARENCTSIILLLFLLSGCERAMHDMYDQRKYKPLAASEMFADGQSSRPLPANTVARSGGYKAGAASGRHGDRMLPVTVGRVYPLDNEGKPLYAPLPPAQDVGEVPEKNPLHITKNLLQHGQERFTIYCSPCHSVLGDGDGMVARRGFPHPPSYHTERLRQAPDRYFFKVITRGYGMMYPYADRLSVPDRWAVVAYIRALQLSQHLPTQQYAGTKP